MACKRKKTRSNRRRLDAMTLELYRRAKVIKAGRLKSLRETGQYTIFGLGTFYSKDTL